MDTRVIIRIYMHHRVSVKAKSKSRDAVSEILKYDSSLGDAAKLYIGNSRYLMRSESTYGAPHPRVQQSPTQMDG